MSEPETRVETPLNPTEDPEKVSKAVTNLFPHASLATVRIDDRHSKMETTMTGLDALENLKTILRKEAIRGAARRLLLSGVTGSLVVVHLNKQAAFAGRASFCERYDESPLGPITLTIRSENPEQIVDWLAPSMRGRKDLESRSRKGAFPGASMVEFD